MRKEWIVIGAIIGIALITVGFAWMTYKPKSNVEVNPINVEVTSVELEYSYMLDSAFATVTIFNHGDSRTVTVWAELKQDHTWQKTKTVSIDSKDTMELTFEFKSYDPYRECKIKAWVSY